jgi:outer membrane receptor protein involved in Fe transport
MKYLFLFALLLLLLNGRGAAFSQTARDTIRTFYFDPVVVTGTNTDALRSSLPNSISVVGTREIKESGETSLLSIINKRVPGVFITERGVLGYAAADASAGSINIRGTGGSPNTEVLVMTDGRPQMMGLFGHPLPDTYVSSDVERVEVIRGPASLVHGTNAMGGVVNIITRQDHMPGLQARGAASYGSFGTEKVDAGAAYGFDGGAVSISGNHYQTDGHRDNSSFRMNNGSVSAQGMLGENFYLSADASVSGFKAYDPGPVTTPAIGHWANITRSSSGVSLEQRGGQAQGAVKLFFNTGVHDIYDGFHSTDNNIGVRVYEGYKLGASTQFTAGVDYDHYGGKAENRTFAHDFGKFFVDEAGGYLIAQQTLFDAATVNAGVRLNHHSLYGTVTVPQFGIAVRLDSSLTLKTSASKGFRSPTIRELYLFPAPTPTLQPERMWNYEAGLLYHFGDRASGELTGFIDDGTNMIRVGGFFPNLVLSNSGRFVHRGVEFSGTLRAASGIDLDLTYGYLDPGDQTMASPRHKLYVGGSYEWAVVRWNLGIQHVEKLYGADFGGEPLPDYTIVNSRITWKWLPNISFFISGENLLNTGYTIMYGYPMPGRTLIGGLSFDGSGVR